MRIKAPTLVLIILTLLGCSLFSDINMAGTPEPSLGTYPADITVTVQPPASITTTTPFAAPSATQSAAEGCLPVTSQLSANSPSGGYLLVGDQVQHSDFLMDMKSFERIPLSSAQEKWQWITRITPNGKQLAYNTKESLVVTQADGTEIMSMPYDWKTQRFRWLNNQELLIYNRLENDMRVPTLLLNPSTGEKKKLSRDFPAIFWDASIWTSWAFSYDSELFRYDPTLKYVIYPLDPQSGETGFAVTDVARHQIVTRLPFQDMTSLPVWSPDGQSFVFASHPPGDLDITDTIISDVLLGSPDGEITTLVKMSDYFNAGIILPKNFYWSPDGHYVLFTSDFENKPGTPGWMVINIETKETLSLCTEGASGYGSVAWAPDSRHFAVASEVQSPMFLVDLIEKKAVQINNMVPIGWLAK
jgi:hypothetical protein